MLVDRRRIVEIAARHRINRVQLVEEYGAFLKTLFETGDWFVTITFRDLYQDADPALPTRSEIKRVSDSQISREGHAFLRQDPRIENWEPDSKYRYKSGPPVRDRALREVEHWLVELGMEAVGRGREIMDILTEGKDATEKADFEAKLVGRCPCCALLGRPNLAVRFKEFHSIATKSIGWVLAEEFGRVGGRYHVHLIVRGVQRVRRDLFWRRAFDRFGRSRIEPING
jgi:hypothetical protein